MKFSYIKPRPKNIISDEFKIVGVFFITAFVILIFSFGIMQFKSHEFKTKKIIQNNKIMQLQSTIQDLKKAMFDARFEVSKAAKIGTANTVLQESIKNLFDLVPNRIVLSKVDIAKNSLLIYGHTPNKNLFRFMLQAPLSSIFTSTSTTFYQLPNGSLNFVCKNYINEDNL